MKDLLRDIASGLAIVAFCITVCIWAGALA